MKLFASIAAAASSVALFGSALTLITPVPAEARNGWLEAGCNYDNECLYIRRKSRTGSIAKFQTQMTGSVTRERTGNRHTWQVNSVMDGNMINVIPETLIEATLQIACR